MSWLLLFALLTGGLAWWFARRRFIAHWRHLEGLVDDIAAGKIPSSFVFHDSRRFTRIAGKLEALADERAALTKRIADQKFNFEAIHASMAEGVMVVDSERSIRIVNDSFCKLFDLSASPLGQTVLGALRDASIEELVRTTLQSGQPQTREVSPVNRAQRCFAISAVPLRDAGGQITGSVSVFHDISRLRKLEEVRREFVANVSHELRTPLSIFHGYLENLLDEPDMPGDQRAEVLRILKKHSSRLNALIEDLLTLARLESRDDRLELTEIQLEPFVRALLQDWRRKFVEKEIDLRCEIDADLPPLTVDTFRFEQVFGNLLENAVKFTPAGGTITVSASAKDGEIAVTVADTGIGIPPADVPHIFERFYRVEKARSRESGGTGLGLSIVKHIVALHGGSVEAKSTFGKGCAITIRLPRKR